MRILWHSNAPWAPSGYGQQTAMFMGRIRRLGHDVALSLFFGLHGGLLKLDDIPAYPGGEDAWGNDVLAAHAGHFRADIVISLMDVWVLQPQMTMRFRWCPWAPVDHEPIPHLVAERLKTAYKPIAYSRFGWEQMRSTGLDPAYVPHGVETSKYHPLPSKAEARQYSKLPAGAFLVSMVAANNGLPSRKGFPEAFQAFKMLLDKHNDAYLYIHTKATGGAGMPGVDIAELAELVGIPKSHYEVADRYQYFLGYPVEYLNAVYNASDVLLNPAYGEGFGLPVLEAQACGTPVIVSDNTAMRELCFGGWKVPCYPFFSGIASWWGIPKVGAIYEALEELYNMGPTERQGLSAAALRGAKEYDADLVTRKYWKPLLEELDAQIHAGSKLEMVQL